ncbi:MAG: sigma-70 family RNA polymerase sigma factor [Thermoanaerobaculia bacterium]|nr:sigma-70 family RNA polymerase sigma factor [Thermoanaerobaculia bacterium]
MGELFERHHEVLWRFAVRLTGDPEAAGDAVQETFVRALRSRLPAAPTAARAWLMRTLVNLTRDRHRRRRVRRNHADRLRREPRPVAGGDLEAGAHARREVDRAVRALTPRRRAVLVLAELEGQSPAEIAALLDIREATVRWHLAAARRSLRRALGAEDP